MSKPSIAVSWLPLGPGSSMRMNEPPLPVRLAHVGGGVADREALAALEAAGERERFLARPDLLGVGAFRDADDGAMAGAALTAAAIVRCGFLRGAVAAAGRGGIDEHRAVRDLRRARDRHGARRAAGRQLRLLGRCCGEHHLNLSGSRFLRQRWFCSAGKSGGQQTGNEHTSGDRDARCLSGHTMPRRCCRRRRAPLRCRRARDCRFALPIALADRRARHRVLDMAGRCPAPRLRFQMEVAIRRIGKQRIGRRHDAVAERDLQALVRIFGLHHRMRDVDPDLVAAAGRSWRRNRCPARCPRRSR